jgi:hypothetical protein
MEALRRVRLLSWGKLRSSDGGTAISAAGKSQQQNSAARRAQRGGRQQARNPYVAVGRVADLDLLEAGERSQPSILA